MLYTYRLTSNIDGVVGGEDAVPIGHSFTCVHAAGTRVDVHEGQVAGNAIAALHGGVLDVGHIRLD